MGIRKVRLDEESLKSLLSDGLRDAGFMAEGSKIVGLEFRTRTIKRDGWYHEPVGPDHTGEVEVVKWVRVLIDVPDKAEERET